jgi:hypothetical protein
MPRRGVPSGGTITTTIIHPIEIEFFEMSLFSERSGIPLRSFCFSKELPNIAVAASLSASRNIWGARVFHRL